MGTHDFFKRDRRRVSDKKKRDTFLIVCEGERTEPNYFKKFPLKKEVIEVDIIGEGENTNTLVQEAIKLKREALLLEVMHSLVQQENFILFIFFLKRRQYSYSS